MPNYRAAAKAAAAKYGIPPNIFLALVKQESGWRPGVTSSAGAIGLTQLMPGTAQGLGVDPYDPIQNLDGGARYLAQQYKRFGTWRQALAAYNAGPGRVEDGSWTGISQTTNYVKNILGMAGKNRSSAPSVTAAAAPALGADASPLGGSALDLSGPITESLATVGTKDFDPVAALSNLAMSVAGQQSALPGVSAPVAAPRQTSPRGGALPPAASGGANPAKWLVLPTWGHASGAAEPGNAILSFAAGIGKALGQPIQVWDTTGHDKMTTNGTVSAHWTGNALDLPATGSRLIRMGRIALMRAGMPRKQAMRAGPGLYNVGGYQIIFGTNDPKLGGNHTDHLHVGIRS